MATMSQLCVFVFLLMLFIDGKCLNTFTQYHFPSIIKDVYVWNSTSDFVPNQSTSYGNMTIGDEMTVEFDFVYNGVTDAVASKENFFRYTHTPCIHTYDLSNGPLQIQDRSNSRPR